jgi:hypothetical protein
MKWLIYYCAPEYPWPDPLLGMVEAPNRYEAMECARAGAWLRGSTESPLPSLPPGAVYWPVAMPERGRT